MPELATESTRTETEDGLKLLIGRRLRQIREPRPVRAFAERLGVSYGAIGKWESGDIPSMWLALSRLRDEEGIDLNALLTSKENGR